MADQMPEMDPAAMIAEQGQAMTARLVQVAADVVKAALAAGSPATPTDVLNLLQGLAETLPPDLAATVAADLPKIAEQAVTAAEIEIADARAESEQPFQPIIPPPVGDASSWCTTAVAALIASIRKRVEPAAQVPTATAGELSATVMDELDSEISAAVSALVDTMTARTVNESRMEVFRQNSDIVQKVKVITVADAKRSEVCTNMSGAVFDPKRPVPTPPFHANCRSYLRAITTAKRKSGATDAEVYRQNWAIYRRLQREAKAAAEKAAAVEGRSAAPVEFRFAPGEAGQFSGYASIWGELDRHGTTFARGAFAASVAEQRAAGHRLPMLWNHSPDSVIGTWEQIEEDSRGLKVRGRIVTETRAGAEAYALLKAGSLNGLSVGFRRQRDEPRPGGGRTITMADLAEISLVGIPSSKSARVQEVRCSPAVPDAALQKEKATMAEETTQAPGEGATETRTDTGAETRARAALDALVKRVDKLEARSTRLGLGGSPSDQGATIERRSFESYLRGGTAGMDVVEARALRTGDDPSAGYLAPPEFIAEIDKNIVQWSPVRGIATVRNTARGSVELPRRIGRPTATWVEEVEDREDTATGTRYGKSTYEVKELTAYVDVSFSTLEDAAVDIFAELAADLAEEFGQAEGAAFVNGDGIKRPFGFMADDTIPTVASGHASQVTADGLIDLYHALPAPYRANAVWALNGATLGAVRKLKTTTGEYLLSMSGLAGAPVTTLLGRPVVEMPDLPDVGAGTIPIVFGDFANGYRVFDRTGFALVRDDLTQRTKGKCRFHARKRVAGGVRKAEALRKLRIATN